MRLPYKNSPSYLSVEILTPTHVGGALENRWKENLDYVCDNRKVYRILEEKLFAIATQPNGELDHKLNTALETGKLNKYIRSKNGSSLDSLSRQVWNMGYEPKGDIYSLIEDGTGQPYIPGSSLKGALRSIIASTLIQGRKSQEDPTKHLGTIEKNLMRFFQIGDIHFESDPTHLYSTKIFNLFRERGNGDWEGGWKHEGDWTDKQFIKNRFNTTYQCFQPRKKGKCSLIIKEGLRDYILAQNGAKLPPFAKVGEGIIEPHPIPHLFGLINQHTKQYLEREIHFFESFPQAKYTDIILEEYHKILRNVPTHLDTCILRIGAGSGFHSITGDWRYEDHTISIDQPDPKNSSKKYRRGLHYKSRKFAFKRGKRAWEFFPMGFIRLTQVKREEWEAFGQNSSSPQSNPPIDPILTSQKEEPQEPKYFKGKIKNGKTEVDAMFVREAGKQKIMKLYIDGPGKEQEVPVKYHASLDSEKIYTVTITNSTKDGTIIHISRPVLKK